MTAFLLAVALGATNVVDVKVDWEKTTGPVRPVNAVGQPPMVGGPSGFQMMHYLQEAGIPYSRLHDVGGWLGQGLWVDVPNLFPDFEADENDPANYAFDLTDALLKALAEKGVQPYFRLGVTIENFAGSGFAPRRIGPPKDFAKWARVCEHVIRHYTEGWADGLRLKIDYWEIWNEPENSPDVAKNPMWRAPFGDYIRFYGTVAPYLKAKFPHLRIGGYGSCGFYAGVGSDHIPASNSSPRRAYFVTCARDFLKAVRDNAWPLDFFSFHSYSCPAEAMRQIRFADELLDEYGFTRERTERHFNEWLPYVKHANLGSALQAAGIAAELIGLQNGPCAVACIYDARCGVGNYSPLFNPLTYAPHKAYYAFTAFNELRRLGTAVSSVSSDASVWVAAARGGTDRAVMLANDSDETKPLRLDLGGCAVTDCRITDADRTDVRLAGAPDGLPPRSFCVIRLKAAPIRVGETVSGFRVKSVTELPDVPGRLWRMEYERNGADLVWLDRADENRTFAIAFRTIPSDDCGIAHIMEHSVLCGSAKYPVKEPFVELLKSSFATYLNAWTSADCTTYPVATKNARDYLNLVDVYLDAVFHPLSVRDDWAMRQEGWHYEFDGTNLTRNGIVYSEMKAVFANPETIGWHENVRRLFPDNAYGKISGGDPAHIPELTFDAYKAFHARFYHPSNARIFLDGRVDLKATLALLDTYLRDYPRRTVDAAVPRQKPVSSAATVEYACDEEGERVLLADGWVHGAFDDLEESQAMDVLCEALAGSNEAPLMKALLDAGLCKDLDLSYGGYEQGILLLSVKNTSAAKAEACRRLVRETLVRLCRDGLDQRRLAAILDRQEFRCREMDSSQRGLRFFGAVRRQWLYGGDPAADLGFTALFAKLRARLGTGWYEKLLKAAVLDNPHHAEVTLVPSRTLAARRLQAERAELARIREGLSPAALERIAADAKALKARQSAPDRAEDLAKLPRLRLKDIPAEGPVPRYAVTNVDAVTVIRPEAAVDGIVYLDLCFSLAGLSDDELLDVPFLAEALGKIGTRRFAALELRNELDGRLGAFEVSADSYAKGPQLVVRVSALEARKADALELSGEVLFGTRFDDRTAIGRLRTQRREALERSARAYGLGFARRRARRSLSEKNRIDDLFGGLAQLRRMQDPREAPLADLAKKVFTRERLTLALAGRMDANFLRRAIALCPSASEPAVRPPAAAAKRTCEGYVADGAVGYTAFAARLPADAPYRGSQLVAAKIVSLDHLWNEIRVKGGAYGGNLEVDADGNVTCASWRDPNPARSLVQFRRSAAALETFVKSGRPLESYQISTAKATEPNLSPREEAAFARRLHFNGRTPGLLQRLRKEILTTTADDLLSFACTLDELSDGASTCVFANETLLKACSPDSVERIDSGIND